MSLGSRGKLPLAAWKEKGPTIDVKRRIGGLFG